MTTTQERIQTAANVLDELVVDDLTATERHALVVLGAARFHDEPVPMRVLADRTGLSRAAITALVDRLEHGHKMARRVPSVTDRRCTLIELTETGYETVVAITNTIPASVPA